MGSCPYWTLARSFTKNNALLLETERQARVAGLDHKIAAPACGRGRAAAQSSPARHGAASVSSIANGSSTNSAVITRTVASVSFEPKGLAKYSAGPAFAVMRAAVHQRWPAAPRDRRCARPIAGDRLGVQHRWPDPASCLKRSGCNCFLLRPTRGNKAKATSRKNDKA